LQLPNLPCEDQLRASDFSLDKHPCSMDGN
jgi:hypothetical protein